MALNRSFALAINCTFKVQTVGQSAPYTLYYLFMTQPVFHSQECTAKVDRKSVV